MSRSESYVEKWNDPDARDNYALLITLDNIIISFILCMLIIALQPILSGKFLEYSIHNLKVTIYYKIYMYLICSYNVSKILFSVIEMYNKYDRTFSNFDDYRFKNKFSYYQFVKALSISSINAMKKQSIRMALYSILWIVTIIVLSMQSFASYGTKNSIQQVMCLNQIDNDIKTNNIIEYDIINPNVYTSSNGLHYIISYYNQDDTELILTNSQYDLLKNE